MPTLRYAAMFAAAGALALLLFAGKPSPFSAAASAPRDPNAPPQPVIVELFTSEGCSSCPPADALLRSVSEKQPFEGVHVIALEEHVDYWNHLGWADPYSSRQFTERQESYGSAYTPQVLIDGWAETVGSRQTAVRENLLRAASLPKASLALSLVSATPEKRAVQVQISELSKVAAFKEADLWIVVTEKNLQSDVKAGENSGETLRHAPVVRLMQKAATLHGAEDYKGEAAIPVSRDWKPENLSVVAFLADKRSHKIIAAASVPWS